MNAPQAASVAPPRYRPVPYAVRRILCERREDGSLILSSPVTPRLPEHLGFAGYLPNPLQVATVLLEGIDSGWVAPCPLLLPLRPTALVAEEIAWLNARHPGRVGLGVAIGALPADFEAMRIPFAEAIPRFKEAL
ncbi:MAG: LLM class flavin-dependent oxidoreductase, partial [Burkholderiales bacterium]|nr:LLM class flavin-dependent oxidoreductase [Burkholderiales bacterium]